MEYKEVINQLNEHTSQDDLNVLFDDIQNKCESKQFKFEEIVEIVSVILKMNMKAFSNELKEKCWNALEAARLNYYLYALFDWRPMMNARVVVEENLEAYVDGCINEIGHTMGAAESISLSSF